VGNLEEKMEEQKSRFLGEIEASIKRETRWEHRYNWGGVFLNAVIVACGFLVAAAGLSQSKLESVVPFLPVFGLVSAVCASVNLGLKPVELHQYHRNRRLACDGIRGAVNYRGMSVSEAELLREKASQNPQEAMNDLANHGAAPKPVVP